MWNKFLVLSFCFFLNQLHAQVGTGQWRMHLSSQNCFDVAIGNGTVLGALTKGVIEYDIETGEKSLLNRVNKLSDIDVSALTFDPSSNSFFIGYKTGNIDQYLEDGTVINIPAIKLAQILGSKEVFQLKAHNGLLYASAPFGVVVINIAKQEVKDTYYPNGSATPIIRTAFLNDSIYCLTNTGLFKSNLSNPLLADESQWSQDVRVPSPTGGKYTEIETYGDSLFIVYKLDLVGDSLMRLYGSEFKSSYCNACQFEIGSLKLVDNDLYFNTFGAIVQIQNGAINEILSVTNSNYINCVKNNNKYYIADLQTGLVEYNNQFSTSFISVSGPARDRFYSVNSFSNKIVVGSTTLDPVVINYTNTGAYIFEDEEWAHVDNTQTLLQGLDHWSISNGTINPLDKSEIYLSSYSPEPLQRVVNNQVVEVINPSNSPLDFTSLGNDMVCLSDVKFDEKGNLWVLNAYSNNPLKVRKTDGTWVSMNTGSESKNTYVSDLEIDYNGNIWFAISNVGVIGFDFNETIDNTADDIFKILRQGEGQGNLPSKVVNAIGVDFDNEIWIGTDEGFVVLYNSEGLFSASGVTDASEILIDFEGIVEVFLNNTAINDIKIDGGNRKWIGTSNSGIYCLSQDGQTIVANYTAENSPLISNTIYDMDFNHTTGEMFIVTSIGLVSLRTDATYEDPEYANTIVFPNPVKPEYVGPITIQGIRYNSDVKITDVAGNLVFKTTSNGGTATWNGKTLDGNDVPGGVYLIWTATNEKFTGKNKQVGKVVVIR
jgi:ligand-binding sensor domain-containing protein